MPKFTEPRSSRAAAKIHSLLSLKNLQVYVWLSPFAIHLRLSQHCQLAICLMCLVAQSYQTLQSHGLYSARLLCLWDFPGKNTGVGCHALLQGIFPTLGWNPRLLHCRRILYLLSIREAHTPYKIKSLKNIKFFLKIWVHKPLGLLHMQSTGNLALWHMPIPTKKLLPSTKTKTV